jgi:hypothetical protein
LLTVRGTGYKLLDIPQVNYRAASGTASKSLKEKPHAASREESDPTRLNQVVTTMHAA